MELEARQLTFSRKENGIRPFSRSQNRLKTRWSAVILLFNGAKGVHIVLLSVLCCTFQNVDKLEHLCSELKLEKLFKTLEKCYLSNKYFLCSVCFYFRSYESTKHKTSCDSENCSISALSFVCDRVLLCSSGWPQTHGNPPPLPPWVLGSRHVPSWQVFEICLAYQLSFLPFLCMCGYICIQEPVGIRGGARVQLLCGCWGWASILCKSREPLSHHFSLLLNCRLSVSLMCSDSVVFSLIFL